MSGNRFNSLFIAITCLVASSALQAQHAGHRGQEQHKDSTGIVAMTETRPRDDAVLSDAPQRLQLQFPGAVRLVKLTLRNEQRDWVDINFRYSPRPVERFSLSLPPLQSAVYYTADWAILAENDQLLRGSFSFAFGSGAEAPSRIKAEEALRQRPPGLEQGARFVAPPPTRIIIDQQPRRFDPPFTIELDDDN